MGWWFGRKSAPADARPFVPTWLSARLCADAAEEGFASSHEARFDEVYRRNPVGQRAVRLIAGMLGGRTIDGDPRALALIGANGLLETVAANLLLNGNAYVQLVTGGDDEPARLYSLRPERVSVVADDRGWPVAYLYNAGSQAVRINRLDGLARQQLAHVKALSPRRVLAPNRQFDASCGALRSQP